MSLSDFITNNNNQVNIYGADIINQESLREFTQFTRWMQNSTRRLPTFGPSRQTWACRQLWNYIHHRHHYYSARKLILILPPTEGRRLSRPRWLVTCPDSSIQVVTGPVTINYVDWSQSANHYTTLPAAKTPSSTPLGKDQLLLYCWMSILVKFIFLFFISSSIVLVNKDSQYYYYYY